MNLVINKDNVSTLNFNGFEVETLIYNGIEVWKKESEPLTYDYQVARTLSELSTDDNIFYAYTYDNSKWNALNTDNQYEQWGIIEETDDINSISKYDGKLAILNGDTKYEYQYSNNQWNNVGEVTGGFGLIGQIDRDNPPSTFPIDFYIKQSDVESMDWFDLNVTSPNWEWRLNVTIFGGTDGEYRIEGNGEHYDGTIEAVNIGGVDYVHFSCPDCPNDSIDVENIDWWYEPIDYYGNSTVMPIRYDKTIFNDYSLYQGYPYNSLDEIEIMGKGIVYNIDGYLYKDNKRTTTNPYNLDYTYGKYGILSGTSITEIKLLDENIDAIGNDVFKDCSNLTSAVIGNTVTSIGSNAFNGCSSLTSVDIPSSVTSIGSGTFQNCSGLTSVTIPNSVRTINGWAFDGCRNITSIEIPSSVTSIGSYAFNGCTSLTSIEVPSSLTSINNNVFSNCSGLTSITIPSSVTSIGSGTFQNCSGLTSVTIPNSVRTINGWAFDGCRNITSIEIPSSVTSIGSYAFYNLPTTGTLYCDENWFNNLSSTNKSNLGNVKNWTRKPIEPKQ